MVPFASDNVTVSESAYDKCHFGSLVHLGAPAEMVGYLIMWEVNVKACGERKESWGFILQNISLSVICYCHKTHHFAVQAATITQSSSI
jgi:hypothetical protein